LRFRLIGKENTSEWPWIKASWR